MSLSHIGYQEGMCEVHEIPGDFQKGNGRTRLVLILMFSDILLNSQYTRP